MSDDFGRMRLSYSTGIRSYTYDFGTVTGIQESFQKSAMTTPIPSLPVDNAFTIESRTSKVITLSFTRKQPLNPTDGGSDPSRWSNARWVQEIESAVGRWQCRTDGFTLSYSPSADNPFIAAIDENGYVRDLTLDYVAGRSESVKGTLEFHVGTMYVKSASPTTEVPGRAQSAFQVALSGSNQNVMYPILYDGGGCVDSYTLYGGPEYPFEFARLTIPKKKLAQVAPRLFSGSECDIKAGKNILTINAVGSCNMTVTKVKLSDSSYTITAYCNAEKVRGYVLESTKSLRPLAWIRLILSGNTYGLNFTESNMVWQFDQTLSDKLGDITFKEGTNVWYILQICAMCMGARVFFAGNKAYVIDYRMTGTALKDFGTIDLHPGGSNAIYAAATLGSPELGDEGADTIMNALTVNCTSNTAQEGQTKAYQYTYRDQESITVYKERAGNTMYISELRQTDPEEDIKDTDEEPGDVTENNLSLDLSGVKLEFSEGDVFNCDGIQITYTDKPEGSSEEVTVRVDVSDCTIVEPQMGKAGIQRVEISYGERSASYTILVKVRKYDQAEQFSRNYVAYRREPQQSVSFTLKEMRTVSGEPTWVPYFGPAAVASNIRDEYNDIYVDNISDIDSTETFQKLALSSYERSFPQGKTTYSWGVMASIDLSSSTSQITTSLSNVKN